MLYIVDHWQSILDLPQEQHPPPHNAFMQNHYNPHHQFLIRAGISPIYVPIERELGPMPRIAAVQTHIAREYHGLTASEQCVQDLQELRAKVLARYHVRPTNDGFSEYMYWRCRLRARLINWKAWKEGSSWELEEGADYKAVNHSLRSLVLKAAAKLIDMAKAYGHGSFHFYHEKWQEHRADLKRGMELQEELKRLRGEVILTQTGLDD